MKKKPQAFVQTILTEFKPNLLTPNDVINLLTVVIMK